MAIVLSTGMKWTSWVYPELDEGLLATTFEESHSLL